MVCQKCRWTVCARCSCRPKLPPLESDPLFYGRHSPCLLEPIQAGAAAASRGTVIVCPGGNYEFRVPHEGMPAAEWLAGHGIRAYVLRYRLLPDYGLTEMLDDLASAVACVRRCHRGPVVAMGFSAGGHLVASSSIHSAGKKTTCLDAQVLVYPCIDSSDWGDPDCCGFFDYDRCFPAAQSLLASREALLGGKGFAAPPTFLVASTADEASPPKEHTDIYARALRRHKVPCTYLRRDFGPHGFGLEGGWAPECIKWLQAIGIGSCSANAGGD